MGAALGYFGTEDKEGDWDIVSREEVAGILAVTGAGTGALVGGLIGYIAPESQWRSVPLPAQSSRTSGVQVHIAPAGDAQVRLSYSF